MVFDLLDSSVVFGQGWSENHRPGGYAAGDDAAVDGPAMGFSDVPMTRDDTRGLCSRVSKLHG